MATLTKKQERMKKLLDDGKSVAEVAQRLKITPNGVYQGRKRLEEMGVLKANGSRKVTRRRKTTRKTTHRSTAPKRATRRKTTRRPKPNTSQPVLAIEARMAEIEGEVQIAEAEAQEARDVAREFEATLNRLNKSHADELERLTRAHEALTGPVARRASGQNGARGKGGLRAV